MSCRTGRNLLALVDAVCRTNYYHTNQHGMYGYLFPDCEWLSHESLAILSHKAFGSGISLSLPAHPIIFCRFCSHYEFREAFYCRWKKTHALFLVCVLRNIREVPCDTKKVVNAFYGRTSNVNRSDKQNSDLLSSRVGGTPRICSKNMLGSLRYCWQQFAVLPKP